MLAVNGWHSTGQERRKVLSCVRVSTLVVAQPWETENHGEGNVGALLSPLVDT